MNHLAKSRFLNIDALRGIAALSVLIFHAFGGVGIFKDIVAVSNIKIADSLYFIPAFGYTGIYLFFVISGFCIHLRWAKSIVRNEDSKIDAWAFWKRRWIRLYPAYIAAIIIFLAWQYQEGLLVFNSFFVWDMISHLLMIHNFDSRTVYSMNGVFWTLAIEEQLYLLYFLLIYLRRNWGWKTTLIICFISRFVWLAISLACYKLIGFELPFSEGALANWWIWALGAIAVENYFGIIKLPRWCYSLKISALMLLTAAAIHYTAFATTANKFFVNLSIVAEPLFWGGGFFLLINHTTAFEGKWNISSIGYKLIKLCAFAGLFSYSLYLTHEVILHALKETSPFVLCLLSLVFAYVFFLLFEKPFMNYLTKKKDDFKTPVYE